MNTHNIEKNLTREGRGRRNDSKKVKREDGERNGKFVKTGSKWEKGRIKLKRERQREKETEAILTDGMALVT